MTLHSEEKSYQVALWSVDGIGRRTFRKILSVLSEHQISIAEFWQRSTRYSKLLGLHKNQVSALQVFKTKFSVSAYLDYLAQKQITILHELDSDFPANLALLDDRPPVLFVQGKIEFPTQAIAVVGTRKVTSYGRLVTEKIVKELVQLNTTIISGFMYGVDAVAHQTAHQVGGRTIGVLGFGFDHIYPRQFATWKKELLAAGHTFVTEYAPHVQPTKGTFPARNRLMAGLTQGVLVTEAASKSGSHITAEWAAEYGRSIYAVPGPITNPYTEGTKALLNEGALFVQSGQEIADDLGWVKKTELSPLAQQLYQELVVTAQSLSSLMAHFKQPSSRLLTELSHLEIKGLVRRSSQGWIVQKPL